MYETGEGASQDLVAAYQWYSLAVTQGYEEATVDRDRVKGKLSAEQVVKGDLLVKEWGGKHSKK
jgi:TPR repeat protein